MILNKIYHVYSKHTVVKKEPWLSSASFGLTSQTLQIMFSSHLPLKNPGVLFITELPTITHLWTQNLLLPFPITYFSLSCTPNEFGIKHRTYRHLANYIFSYHSLLFLLIPHPSPNSTPGEWRLESPFTAISPLLTSRHSKTSIYEWKNQCGRSGWWIFIWAQNIKSVSYALSQYCYASANYAKLGYTTV